MLLVTQMIDFLKTQSNNKQNNETFTTIQDQYSYQLTFKHYFIIYSKNTTKFANLN